jgi:AP endonuclease-2
MMPAIGTKKETPRLCAKHWEECAQKQALLPNFFKKKTTCASDLTSSQPGTQSPGGPDSMGIPGQQELTEPTARPKSTPAPQPQLTASRPGKRKNTRTDTPTKKKIKIDATGQAKLSSFFTHPKNPVPGASRAPDLGRNSLPKDRATATNADSPREEDDEAFQKDILLAISLSQEERASSSVGPSKSKEKGKAAWSHILAPIEAPLCDVHKEPTREYTVNKPGPNKGKRFFLCSRFGENPARDMCAEPVT